MSKVNTYINCNDDEEAECLNDFIDSIQTEMSVGGGIPFTIPAEPIAIIVKNTKEIFYRMSQDAVEEMYIVLPEKEIRKKSFSGGITTVNGQGDDSAVKNSVNTRGSFKLPSDVVSVVGVYEINGFSGEAGWNSGLLGKHTGDISINRMLYQSVYDRNVSVSADNTMYYVCTESFLDISRQLFQAPISTRYNRLTNNLRFMGKLPKSDVILDVLVKTPSCDLFIDPLFRKYVMAECKTQLGRIIGSYNFNMPGNITLNVDKIAGEGSNEKQEVIQELKDMSGSWYIMTC